MTSWYHETYAASDGKNNGKHNIPFYGGCVYEGKYNITVSIDSTVLNSRISDLSMKARHGCGFNSIIW